MDAVTQVGKEWFTWVLELEATTVAGRANLAFLALLFIFVVSSRAGRAACRFIVVVFREVKGPLPKGRRYGPLPYGPSTPLKDATALLGMLLMCLFTISVIVELFGNFAAGRTGF